MLTNTRKILEEKQAVLLPKVTGRYSFDVMLSGLTWFQVGGPASVVFKPEDTADLQYFLKNKLNSLPHFVIGAGSNILVRDGGFNGAIIKLGRGFSKILIENGELIAGAAVLDRTLSIFALQHNIKGFEFLVTIPGSVGGAIAMNAGCYGFEVKDILSWVEIVDQNGNLHRLYPHELKMTYRKSVLPKGCVVVRAGFRAEAGDNVDIQYRIQEYLQLREESQPIKGRTGGSTFKNPDSEKAWKLIDEAGCRGISIGSAKISEKHCNFMLNTGGASADELERLGEIVRQKVKEYSGKHLEWEIIRIGQSSELKKSAA